MTFFAHLIWAAISLACAVAGAIGGATVLIGALS